MTTIRPRDRDAVLQSLRAGVVPRIGQHLIQVGRAHEARDHFRIFFDQLVRRRQRAPGILDFVAHEKHFMHALIERDVALLYTEHRRVEATAEQRRQREEQRLRLPLHWL